MTVRTLKNSVSLLISATFLAASSAMAADLADTPPPAPDVPFEAPSPWTF
ncbi:hypothetical protein ABLO27_18270 [Roseibium sp. SCPC15]